MPKLEFIAEIAALKDRLKESEESLKYCEATVVIGANKYIESQSQLKDLKDGLLEIKESLLFQGMQKPLVDKITELLTPMY